MNKVGAVLAFGAVLACDSAPAQQSAEQGPYRVLKTQKAGGDGGFDYVYSDSDGRKLYVPRTGSSKRISVFDLDSLQLIGEIPDVGAHGVAIDSKSHHGFASSKPMAMWDSNTLKVIKTIDVQGNPDGILFDAYKDRVYVLSHSAPNVTVVDGNDGSVVGTIDLGGAPEQGAGDGEGHLYIDLEDKNAVAVVDVKAMQVTGRYDLGGASTPSGLAYDVKNQILFVECRNPAVSVVMSARDGKILKTLPIGTGVDGAGFMPQTGEAFSSQGDGTLTIVKENGPSDIHVEQTVKTMPSAKTMTIDRMRQRIFLIAAEFGPAPVSAPGERPRRGPMIPDSFTIIQVGK
jgi:DNA-binding beta-propeller fold protein YncE